MEGVMGVYDGLGGITKEASSYDLAKKTDTPIILVINAKGMSLSVIPLLKGFLDYQDPDGQVIRGVILNRATKMTTALLKKPIEEQTGLKVIGYVPVLEACKVESRHLGLVMPGEVEDLQQRVNQQPSQGQMRAYQKQMAMGYGQRPVQTAQGSSVQKNVPAAKKSSGSAILDRVLRENQDTDTREYNVEETVILDSMGLSMPKIEQSPYMEEVHQMMGTGYEVKMPEQRDFVMEGLALLDQHVG